MLTGQHYHIWIPGEMYKMYIYDVRPLNFEIHKHEDRDLK